MRTQLLINFLALIGAAATTCLNSDEVAYAAMLSTHTVSQRFRDFMQRTLPSLQASSPGAENATCRCAVCTNQTMPDGSEMCVPWKPSEVCNCLGQASSQPYPVSMSVPPSCRPEWAANVTLTLFSNSEPLYYTRGDGLPLSPGGGQEVVLQIHGQATFEWPSGAFEGRGSAPAVQSPGDPSATRLTRRAITTFSPPSTNRYG